MESHKRFKIAKYHKTHQLSTKKYQYCKKCQNYQNHKFPKLVGKNLNPLETTKAVKIPQMTRSTKDHANH